MASPIPASVSRRKRLVLAGDIFLGLAIVAAALHFFALGLSNLLWPIAGIAATMCTTWLRQSIRHLDVPTTEMDEYELRLHTDARDTGLKTAVVISIVLFLVAGATAVGPVVAAARARGQQERGQEEQGDQDRPGAGEPLGERVSRPPSNPTHAGRVARAARRARIETEWYRAVRNGAAARPR